MSRYDFIEKIGGWQGFRVVSVDRSSLLRVEIELRPRLNCLPECGVCGQKVHQVHDWSVRQVRDLPVFGAQTHLTVHSRRVLCPQCGRQPEAVDWLDRYSRLTHRLAEGVVRLCDVLPIKHVAEHFGLGWDAVKRVHKRYLKGLLEPLDLSGVTVIGMDEFAIQTGHRYATVVIDMETGRVLWVGRGRTREDIRRFFDLIGRKRCHELRAVAMDMHAAYAEEVRVHCPHAEIVYDLFHVVAKYGREVIDRVRVDEANRLRDDKKARKIVKGARWLLLRNRSNLSRYEDRIRLQELLAANKRLYTTYILRDDLKHLWEYRYRGAAHSFWKQWYRRAIYSKIDPLKKFARNLAKKIDGVLAHAQWHIGTSIIEGINNKIKVIKRMAYGFRDDEYFFLRIRHAFPGKHG